ncbi:MAG: pyridoxamine 5'-phosphate oxidase family protein [Hyphomicrobiales bacterium]
MTDELKKTARSKVKRVARRAHYDRDTINAVLDATVLCHVAYVIDGEPYCTPTLHWREGDHVYWHGSSKSRFLKSVVGKRACLTVSHLDGLVIARSAFHHSVNYRSAMLYGEVELVSDADKAEKLKNLIDHIYPGRWDSLRPMNGQEVKATTVLRMAIDEGAAKVRTGGPVDDEEDYALPIWAGVVPLRVEIGAPEPDPRNLDGIEIPEHIRNFRLGR